MNNYKGKTIYVGMDVHKRTYSITAVCEGIKIKTDTMKADPNLLIKYLKDRYGTGKIVSAYEAGFCGFYLHRLLIAAGINNIVVHAASIEISNDRVKTDKRDSVKIAIHLSQGRLKCINIPTPEREDFRAITRVREAFIKQRTRTACQIKSQLNQHGLISAYDEKKVSEKWIKSLLTTNLPRGLKLSLEMYIKVWLEFNQKIKEISLEMKEQAKKDNEIDKVYQSCPGIGPTSARILANELGDMSQFKNEGQLFSFVGVTPCEYSSGEHVRQGHITKQGKSILRRILVQAAWTATRNNDELYAVFSRIAVKAGLKRAIIGVARRMIGRIRACFRTDKLYSSPLNQKQSNSLKEDSIEIVRAA